MKNWFQVSTEGLRGMQLGKPKFHIARELIQNAFDENTKVCTLEAKRERGTVEMIITDDNPTGFNNLDDIYTLFNQTQKRKDPQKRGRFCAGEKMSFCVCDKAIVETTKGTIIFDKNGRHTSNSKTDGGSKITVFFKSTKSEYDEMMDVVKTFLPPKDITFMVNNEEIPYQEPLHVVEATLPTQFEIDGMLRETQRKTEVHVHKQTVSYLYEMGLPVVEIDCPYGIDVQQKIPMSVDRESVKPSYLRKVFAAVLNETIDEISDEEASETWIRTASADKDILPETMKKIVLKRFGSKVVVANPNDPIANDDALANGFRVIQGRELSKEEWEKVKENNFIQSTTSMFGRVGTATDVKDVTPTAGMLRVANLSREIAKRFLGFDIKVRFISSTQIPESASYGGRTLSFNVKRLGNSFFEMRASASQLDLIIHELGHEAGHHTEEKYHRMLTKLAGNLIVTALNEPEFFKEASA